jgi:hypothetical protein
VKDNKNKKTPAMTLSPWAKPTACAGGSHLKKTSSRE